MFSLAGQLIIFEFQCSLLFLPQKYVSFCDLATRHLKKGFEPITIFTNHDVSHGVHKTTETDAFKLHENYEKMDCKASKVGFKISSIDVTC